MNPRKNYELERIIWSVTRVACFRAQHIPFGMLGRRAIRSAPPEPTIFLCRLRRAANRRADPLGAKLRHIFGRSLPGMPKPPDKEGV